MKEIKIRKATEKDVDSVAEIYNAIHTEEENGRTTIGWIRSIYPTKETAVQAVENGDLFVLETNGEVIATAKINQEQAAQYAEVAWQYPAKDSEVMSIHTLAVRPDQMRKGYATAFVEFYEKYALEQKCPYLRMDTNEKNQTARKLYKKMGYTEVGVVPGQFNGIPGFPLVCLEKKVTKH